MLDKFLKEKRVAAGLTQPELAAKAGVGLRFVRELEQGKQTLRMDKVNQVLQLFGYQLGPVELEREIEAKPEPGTSLKRNESTVKATNRKDAKG